MSRYQQIRMLERRIMELGVDACWNMRSICSGGSHAEGTGQHALQCCTVVERKMIGMEEEKMLEVCVK